MTDRDTRGFLLSATLHALVVVAVWLAYSFKTTPPPVKIFELVAGAGDNFMATEAPALGSPESVKLDIPAPPTPPARLPVAEVTPTPAPITPAPPLQKAPAKEIVPTPKPAAPEKKAPSLARQIRNKLWAAESKAKAELKKEREAEQKRITKEQFDAANRAKTAKQSKTQAPPPKVAKIDAKGIAKGVVGGSTANTTAGAGGKALTAEEGNEIERYIALLQQRLKEQLDQTPGLEDGLHAQAELHIMSDGKLTRAQITKSSRNDVFDLAVLRAIRAVQMPPRPKGLEQVQVIPFSTRMRE